MDESQGRSIHLFRHAFWIRGPTPDRVFTSNGHCQAWGDSSESLESDEFHGMVFRWIRPSRWLGCWWIGFMEHVRTSFVQYLFGRVWVSVKVFSLSVMVRLIDPYNVFYSPLKETWDDFFLGIKDIVILTRLCHEIKY